MPAATRARHRWHAPEKGSGPAFALSLLAHVVLFIAIAFMVRWKSEPVGTVSAELWSLPPAAMQQPAPVPAPRPAPVEPGIERESGAIETSGTGQKAGPGRRSPDSKSPGKAPIIVAR